MKNRPRIGVLGAHNATEEELAWARAVGEGLARAGAVLLCGGLNGIMEAAAEGARKAGGLTVGILPGDDELGANPYIDLPLPTGLGAVRNTLIPRMSHAVIAVAGAYGTLSEIGFALRLKVPVIGLHTWSLVRAGQEDPGVQRAGTPEEAVRMALDRAAERMGC